MTEQLAVVILAAGQGTRMKSATPKVLHRIGGRPLISHVLDTAAGLRPERVVAVVRHERELVAGAIEDHAPGTVIVDQDETPGTGRAVEQAHDARRVHVRLLDEPERAGLPRLDDSDAAWGW